MARKKSKIIKYKKPWNLNVGIIIFTFIFVYLAACLFVYMSKEKVSIYEVSKGSLTDYADYNALILRNETVAASAQAGYIHYYIRDGRRVGVNDLIYTIDETGQTLRQYQQNTGESSLPPEDLKEFKAEAAQFALIYDPMDFSSVYDMKASMQSSLLEYISGGMDQELSESAGADSFYKVYASESGVISMTLDGLEQMTPEQVTSDAFNSASYPRTVLSSGQQVESGKLVYKTISEEEWYLIFPITESDQERFREISTVNLTVKGSPLRLSGALSIYQGADENFYGKITLNRYMVQFLKKRHVKIQIETEDVTGLKIPVTSVVYKSFYKVPRSYLTIDGELLAEVYGEDGSVTVEKTTPVTYGSDPENCYLPGDESNERFQLAQTEQLPGVYNVNKGYTMFRKIKILEENAEYYIISTQESNVQLYDHIILDTSLVTEGQIIYY